MNKILNDRTLHFLEKRIIDELSCIQDFQNRVEASGLKPTRSHTSKES